MNHQINVNWTQEAYLILVEIALDLKENLLQGISCEFESKSRLA